MEAIVISGMSAAGKTTVSRILANRLGVNAIGGGEILREMAKERGYDPTGDDWWDTDQGMKFLKEREADSEFDKEADNRLRMKIRKGNIIITSYTAPWITKEGFKVWLSASTGTRTERMAKRDRLTIEKTKGIVKVRDIENIKLYKELYGINLDNDTKPFDLIIDTNDKDPEQIADIILENIGKRNK